jgi:hypothetical protein
MALRHNNPSQMVTPIELSPLLKNESPYYNNLNRAPKNAYDYADKINNILSYGGFVSKMRSANSADEFNLYNVVKILDGESITDTTSYSTTDRFGIIVTEKDSDGFYIVCTFCPNFIYPPEVFPVTWAPGEVLHVSNSTPLVGITNTGGTATVGKVTGTQSIFFCGTVRLF